MKRIITLILLVAFALTANGLAQIPPPGAKTVKVKIYLLDQFESANLLENLEMQAVEREVTSEFPLRSALEELLKGATEVETSQLLYSPVSGISLISARVKNKTAYASFTLNGSEKLDEINALRFRKAVSQTALQFPAIRRVEICLDGIADFWLVGAKKHRKCAR